MCSTNNESFIEIYKEKCEYEKIQYITKNEETKIKI